LTNFIYSIFPVTYEKILQGYNSSNIMAKNMKKEMKAYLDISPLEKYAKVKNII
jgi:hypothetical protein